MISSVADDTAALTKVVVHVFDGEKKKESRCVCETVGPPVGVTGSKSRSQGRQR